MKYAIIGIFIFAAMAICIILMYIKRKKESASLQGNDSETVCFVECSGHIDDGPKKFEIQVEALSEGAIPNKSRLAEIVDSKVLTYINNLVPELGQIGNAANNVRQAVKTGEEVVYRAIIPAGTKLADSRNMEGAVRGFYRGTNGIGGHANFVQVKAQKGREIISNTSSAAMGLASMVVGQYYMTQINSELGEISDGISQIVDFQENEYKSRVISLLAHIKRIAGFQVEILENDELRLSKISQLDSLEEECTKLLGQANLTLEGYAKRKDSDYVKYEKELRKAYNWYVYQKSLLDVLYKISDLRYTLHFGSVSREQCDSLLSGYTKQVESIQEGLIKWHQDTMKRLKIDPQKNRRKRKGVDSAIHSIPGLFNHNFRFRPINKNTANMITAQISGYESEYSRDVTDLYAEDVQLIAKKGKVYYLPKGKEIHGHGIFHD